MFQHSFVSYTEKEFTKIKKDYKQISLTRSLTDSNITYACEEILEAPGSAGYINKDGNLDIIVVLQVINETASAL